MLLFEIYCHPDYSSELICLTRNIKTEFISRKMANLNFNQQRCIPGALCSLSFECQYLLEEAFLEKWR